MKALWEWDQEPECAEIWKSSSYTPCLVVSDLYQVTSNDVWILVVILHISITREYCNFAQSYYMNTVCSCDKWMLYCKNEFCQNSTPLQQHKHECYTCFVQTSPYIVLIYCSVFLCILSVGGPPWSWALNLIPMLAWKKKKNRKI